MAHNSSIKNYSYSVIFGRGIYEDCNQTVQIESFDSSIAKEKTISHVPLVKNYYSGEQFLLRRLSINNKDEINRYKQKILSPPNRTVINWPIDCIELTETQKSMCDVYLGKEYTEVPSQDRFSKGNYALLYPRSSLNTSKDGFEKLHQIEIDNRNWRNKEIRKMAIEILKAISILNDDGYLYGDIHFSNFLFKPDGTVVLNDSELIQPIDFDSIVGKTKILLDKYHEKSLHYESGRFPLDFIEPYFYKNSAASIDFHSQNYSITSMLFYLFFNRFPYQGIMSDVFENETVIQYYAMLRGFIDIPIFIFDPNDTSNNVGEMISEREIIELWKDCPREVQELFVQTLCEDSAMRKNTYVIPTAVDWLNCFNKIGWV